MDWERLGFDFQKTLGHVKFTWSNGSWDEGVLDAEPYLKVHTMSSAIHYGQGIFEGAKAHHCADGVVRLWNIDANARRLALGCERMMMPVVPKQTFVQACEWAVAANFAFVPPYETKGAMYLRPFVFGHGPQLGLSPAPMFHFCVLAIPVASYYSSGLAPIDVLVVDSNDRAAPQGVGHVKASGNYGSDIKVSITARADGFSSVLYLDPKEKAYVEEFSVSNFIGIKYDGPTFVTPDTDTVLESTTNDLLMQLARSLGWTVERRPIHVSELAEFDEVAGCGTAVIMMGIRSITHKQTVYHYDSIDYVSRLYHHYRAIQFAENPDIFGWGTPCASLQDLGKL
ncbi:hypothetical protein CTAYLR_007951 [Chrysophaeum taylorii]|uniref:Branched-chain-amino-acid transaminase n=1 Tax=Chrysophaeum taylorii TaxID=2483200 RepID=A0AAD7UM93_9STRA|nr:hypothetical protein CTAYLR_007951 [Chrysophaeum taylorii]